jgi:hypothetical protein
MALARWIEAMDRGLLGIYLRDHYAASAGGVALARRALGANHSLTVEIAHDRETLERLMRKLGIAPNRLKVGLVRLAEGAGRLKLNGRIFGHSPLSDVVELETLVVGVRAKEALWTALRRADAGGGDFDFEKLIESARAQAVELEALRLGAVARAFCGATSGAPRGSAA